MYGAIRRDSARQNVIDRQTRMEHNTTPSGFYEFEQKLDACLRREETGKQLPVAA